MPPLHVVVDRDRLDLLFGWGSITLAVVAVLIALWAQWSVRRERRRASELENAWRVLSTFHAPPPSSEAQREVLTGLLATLRPKDFPILRAWLDPDTRTPEGNRATQDAVAGEYAAAVERRL